jgi:hypothetical protein
MLLYVTLGEPEEREPRPLHTIPDTIANLYLLGMREHSRDAVLMHREAEAWEKAPNWRFDRQVIRTALYSQERLQIGTGERVALFGPFNQTWLLAEFASLGLGAVAVGLSHGLGDDEVTSALRETSARTAFVTDPKSAARLLQIRSAAPALQNVVVPAETSGEASISWRAVLDFGATLDTPERAQRVRAGAAAVEPDRAACWHYARAEGEESAPADRLTHRQAMACVRERLLKFPAAKGDRACFESDVATLAARFAAYAFVGDGHTTTVFVPTGRAGADLASLQPARILASSAWLEALWSELDRVSGGRLRVSPPSGWRRLRARLGQARLRRSLAERTGGALRYVEPVETLEQELRERLERAGVPVAPPPRPPGPALDENDRSGEARASTEAGPAVVSIGSEG